MSLEQQTNIASVQVFQASFADWYLFIQDRIFNVRNGWSHLILILAYNWLPCLKYGNEFEVNGFLIPRKDRLKYYRVMSRNAT